MRSWRSRWRRRRFGGGWDEDRSAVDDLEAAGKGPGGATECSPGSERRRSGDPGSERQKHFQAPAGRQELHQARRFLSPLRGWGKNWNLPHPGSPLLRRSDPGLHSCASTRLAFATSRRWRMRVKVKIEELALEGLPAADHHHIGGAVRSELARLLAERGLPPGLAGGERISKLDGGRIEMRQGERPEAVGRHVAGAVYKGFNR